MMVWPRENVCARSDRAFTQAFMLPLRAAQGRDRLQDEVCFSYWSARKLPFRFRPDYVMPNRHRPQDRTFGFAPMHEPAAREGP
jgi:hypothetical protein